MEVKQLEAEAKAAKHMINTLLKPRHVEEAEQYETKVSTEKASVEAMLKTAMQSELDDSDQHIHQLQCPLPDRMKESLKWVQSFTVDPGFSSKLQDLIDENPTALENFKHKFNVPERVEKTTPLINEGELLHIHKSLTELENFRDDILYELHKLPNQASADKNMLEAYFEDVKDISNLLEKLLRLVLSHTLNTVRKEPTVIGTALQIIEREEEADSSTLHFQLRSDFLPPGRPKKWRVVAMEVLEKAVAQRIEGMQMDEWDDDKIYHLEQTRLLILEDLRVVKTLCVPCFPPNYDIMNKYVKMYHTCLSHHLQCMIQNGLEGDEYVSILAWITNTYPGVELMQHPELKVDISKIGPLLPDNLVKELEESYLKYTEEYYVEGMQKTLETEKADWSNSVPPKANEEGYYHTLAPSNILLMIDQNLVVTKPIGLDLTFKAVLLGMRQVTQYGKMYRDAILEFKIGHFEDRSKIPYFTQYMITIVNNCLHFTELVQQMKTVYWTHGIDVNDSKEFADLLITFQQLRDEASIFLLEEAFLDLELHFQDLITSKWLENSGSHSSVPVDTICATLQDRFQDYVHLRPCNFRYVISEAQKQVAKRYISSMLQQRISFKTYEERRDAALKIMRETEQIKELFIRIAPDIAKFDSTLEIILSLAEVLKSEDPEILSLNLRGIVDKYPDVTEDHLTHLLSLGGDISFSEAKENVASILKNNKSRQRPSIFSLIP